MSVFSHSQSHGRSPWDYFCSFCRRSCVLPMLSLFHIGGPCGGRESFQTRILGSYNKRFKPSLLSAFREQQGGKNGGYSPPSPQPGTMSLDPISGRIAHQIRHKLETPQLPENILGSYVLCMR